MQQTTEDDNTAHFGYRKVPVEDKVHWVRRHFNTVASRYDFMNTLLSFGIHHWWKRCAIGMMDLRSGNQILDLCGGTGDLALLAARVIGPEGRVVLYDINWRMMVTGRPKIMASPARGQIQYVQGDAERIAFPDKTFDAAMVGFGIRNLTRMEKGFEEMYRVLKPGGKMMCLEFSRPVTPWFRALYDFYSFHVMPWVGKIFGGSRQAYTYLPESIRLFPMQDELAAQLKRIGYREVRYRNLTNGISVVHMAVK
ncbi:MAG TPA: bifunctional demethylmenaquinone methyltransferase/2-methoxy-6-polyprenyl-1,4-benzoquinol methylase UbiE [Syntrophobacteraceae bacterium]|nr:bifunctional demethylmenaquinone methyltransferase/2-methoxy-6-polyprenyl-1,4-benzoquinol methylase UbiE [Syntrophobacteraceae bacterium]HBZ53804.1 bifunctional demethylmenaquinone methyltransferase/2-methoxy-6-polyprenyl-1,4-benzoquinol methylase UbiE [Syntrophobacteraceae bacterium]